MNSVRWNIGLGMFVLMTLISFGVYQTLTLGPSTDVSELYQTRFQGQASVLASALNSSIAAEDIGMLSDRLDQLINGADLEYAIVASENGVVSTYTRTGSNIDDVKAMTALPGVSSDGQLYRVSIPVESESSLQLYAGFSTESARESIKAEKLEAAILAFAVLIFGLAGSLILASVITRPLKRLVDAARLVESGDSGAPIHDVRDDEIGAVTRTFNTMTTRVNRLSEQLDEANEDMALYTSEVAALKTERVKFETALKASERRFRTIVENTNDIFIVIDDELKIKWISATYTRAAGRSGSSVAGQSVTDMIHPDDIEAIHAFFGSDDESIPALEARFRINDEGWHDVLINIKDLRTASGVGGVLLTLTNISETKNTQRELENAKETAEEMIRLKDSFLANMSHEIRTPLTGILGFAQVLQEELAGEQLQLVKYIRDGGDRLLKTLNAFLDLAQLESNSVNFNAERLDLVVETNNVVLQFGPEAHNRGIALDVTNDHDVLFARIDRSIYASVLQNLLHNAFKFTSEGSISVHVASEDDWVRVDVSDTGVGIAEEFLPLIFKEFHQESSGLTRKHEGAGLGLAITKRMLDVMKGSISVKSVKGQGSTFSFRVPGATQVRQASSKKSPGENLVMSELPSILLVEDNKDTQLLVSRLIRQYYDVTIASSGNAAVELAMNNKFDLIIMDINLGEGLNGVESLNEIRRLGNTSVPVVAVTAYALPGDEAKFIRSGFNDYLSKPFGRDELLDMIKRNIAVKSNRLAS
ncbi:MAG: response regulator [Rhodothermales bacterium]|nr:response regulator [Rhodothermales bacterium]